MNDFGSVRYNSAAVTMKEQFGCRIAKLSVDGGFTCPNRDGTAGTGGCIYCSRRGSGDFASSVQEQKVLLSRKWKNCRYLVYFQNFTNTYAPVEKLRQLWDDALRDPEVVGLAIATRPDCLPGDVLDLLEEFSKKTFLWVELGLQTESDETAVFLNRCYPTAVFSQAMEKLHARGIRTVVHLILGLPGEDRGQMLRSARFAASFSPFGIKLHMLHVMKDTKLGELYESGQLPGFRLLSQEEYVSLVCDILEELPPQITVHRLTGDAPRDLLIAPEWTSRKQAVLGAIKHELALRGSHQGIRAVLPASGEESGKNM